VKKILKLYHYPQPGDALSCWRELAVSAMAEPRKRRIVRRAVMALVVVVLLPVWYVGAWLAVSRAERDGLAASRTLERAYPVFVPLLRYCESDWPGADLLSRVWWKVNPETDLPDELIIPLIEPSAFAPRRGTISD
jgi:hypothetical protein